MLSQQSQVFHPQEHYAVHFPMAPEAVRVLDVQKIPKGQRGKIHREFVCVLFIYFYTVIFYMLVMFFCFSWFVILARATCPEITFHIAKLFKLQAYV